MSFFSKLKEKATAGIKAAEKYMGNEDAKQGEGVPPPTYKVKTKAQTPHASKDSNPDFIQDDKKTDPMKPQKSLDDPLQQMVKEAAAEFKQKAAPSEPDPMTPGPHGELQTLKAILRVKMKEYDDLVEETTKRDTEYQRLLQEEESKLTR